MKIKDNIHMIESGKGAHIYLIKGKESFIIDCGMPGNIDKILNEIKELGVESKEVTDILLTHSDIDHIGNAKALQDSTGARVWCSKEEYPYVEGKKKRNGLKILIGKIFKAEKPKIYNFFNESEDIKGVRTIFTPGHTEGHTIFLYDKVLFIGDLFQIKNGKIGFRDNARAAPAFSKIRVDCSSCLLA